MKKQYLLTPGPTPLPPEVLAAMGQPIIHHRTSRFQEILVEASAGLQYVLKTRNDVLIFAASGTGVMEAAVVNLLSPGDRALVVKGGKFGERWQELCEGFGIDVVSIDVEWGKSVDPGVIAKTLKKNPVKAVFTTLSETSTGVVNDIKAIGKIVKPTPSVLVVDAISGLGAEELDTDNWEVDVVVAGSQKGLMTPPGLGFVSVSAKAWQIVKSSKSPRYYFDFTKGKKALDKSTTAFTPAVSLIVGLGAALGLIKKEGLDNVLKRHKHLALATRGAIEALGLTLFAASPSNAVTAVKAPQGIDGQALVKLMRDKYGVSIAGGQGELKGKIFRIAHLGYMGKFDIIVGISAVEMALHELGYKVELGKGVRKAEEILSKEIVI